MTTSQVAHDFEIGTAIADREALVGHKSVAGRNGKREHPAIREDGARPAAIPAVEPLAAQDNVQSGVSLSALVVPEVRGVSPCHCSYPCPSQLGH